MAADEKHDPWIRRRVFRRRSKDNREGVAPRAGEMLSDLWQRLGGSDRVRLVALWRAWSEVLGSHLAEMAKPLGSRGRTLVLGADEPLVMQELGFLAPEILARVNAFLGQEHFDKVVFELIDGRIPLDGIGERASASDHPRPKAPQALGGLEHLLRSDSAVARSYQAYVRRFVGERDTGGHS
jgi:hypothetical protein